MLHGALLSVTLLTTTSFGSVLNEAFSAGRALDSNLLMNGYVRLVHMDPTLWAGLSFSLPLLAILLAHEFGHYLECRRRGIDASLPYFLPSPFLLGTFGAVIRIRAPIYRREALFDIGVGGPIAGFVVILPALVAGLVLSKAGSVTAGGGEALTFSAPLIMRLIEHWVFPGLPEARILLHPTAVAAWAGLFATAINLLPIGQLDGGHILYAVGSAHWHRRIGLAFVILLAAAGFLYWPWWIWAVVMFFFGRRHILIYDSTPLSKGRLCLSIVALAILVLSATFVPTHGF